MQRTREQAPFERLFNTRRVDTEIRSAPLRLHFYPAIKRTNANKFRLRTLPAASDASSDRCGHSSPFTAGRSGGSFHCLRFAADIDLPISQSRGEPDILPALPYRKAELAIGNHHKSALLGLIQFDR